MSSDNMSTPGAPAAVAAAAEGAARERLALFFLSMPPLPQQNPAQRHLYLAALRELLALENAAILQAAGRARPLRRGDLAGLLRALLTACAAAESRAANQALPHLHIRTAPDFPAHETAVFEPRLVQAAAVGLLRAAAAVNPGGPLAVSLSRGLDSLILTITGEYPPHEKEALAVARETARLHEGSLAVCEGTVGLSLSTLLGGEAGRYTAPTAADLLRDGLSSVQVGFYSSLE